MLLIDMQESCGQCGTPLEVGQIGMCGGCTGDSDVHARESEVDAPKPPPTALDELPGSLLSAVENFRDQNGRLWKARLVSGWLKSAFAGELQQVRNQYGPEWLRRVKEKDFKQEIVTEEEKADSRPPCPPRVRM